MREIVITYAPVRDVHLEEEKMVNDAIVLWGLMLLYGVPIATLAYWLEKKAREGGEDERAG